MIPDEDIKMQVVFDRHNFTIEYNQGIVLRRDGTLLADYENGKWIWVNPDVSVTKKQLDTLAHMCKAFERFLDDPGVHRAQTH